MIAIMDESYSIDVILYGLVAEHSGTLNSSHFIIPELYRGL
jgi:hypothetical protein